MDVKIEEQRDEEENEISLMQTAKSSPSNSPARTSILLESESADRRQDARMSVRALSSLSSDGSSKSRTVAIAIEAHIKYDFAPFLYAFDNLVEQKVVVIICLSQLRDELGLDRCIDVDSFAGVNMKKLEAAVKTQITNVNHFLRPFRDKLDQRGVPLEIRVSTGPKSLDILIQAAKALHPHWLVLDRSFSGQKKKIQASLECNLVLMKKKGITPEILQVSPADSIHEDEEEPELISCPRTNSRTPSSSPKASPMTRLKSFLRSPTQETMSSSKVIPGITDGGRAADEVDGPRKDQTVLYAERSLGSRSAYLGKEGHCNGTMTQQVPMLLSSRSIRASPIVSPTQSTWLSFRSSSTTKRRNEKSTKLLDQEEIDIETDFSTSSSGSGTSMAESEENARFRMTPTGMVEYTSIGDSEHVKKQGDDVPGPRTPGPSEDPGTWSDGDAISVGG